MIDHGVPAPDFTLTDHFGRTHRLADLRGKKHVLLIFYPLDFTPTWSREVPALEALLPRLTAARVQTFGISVDSVYCHANWAQSLGGVSFPLLADFHPKGAVASAFGLYLEKVGFTDRATVFIDAGGIIRHVSSVTPAGQRDMPALVAEIEALAAAHAGELAEPVASPTLAADARLFIKSRCGFSSAVLLARDNLRLGDRLPVVNVSESAEAMDELRRLTGKEQAPCLVADGQALLESKEIIRYLADRASPC